MTGESNAQNHLNQEFEGGQRLGGEEDFQEDPRAEMRDRHLKLVAIAKDQQNFLGPDHTKPPELRALELNNSLLGAMLEMMHSHG